MSHGGWLSSFESRVAGVTVELSAPYSDLSSGLRSSQVGLAINALETGQMITESQGLDDHGGSLAQDRVTERTDFLATH